jgi:TonB family protein
MKFKYFLLFILLFIGCNTFSRKNSTFSNEAGYIIKVGNIKMSNVQLPKYDLLPLEENIKLPENIEKYLSIPENIDEYLSLNIVNDPPKFNEEQIISNLFYPPLARRSGIEGRVILELFIDREGKIQHINVLQEEPKNRAFALSAVYAFIGIVGTPAMVNGIAVPVRYRYPISFRMR